jgi:hypothetical protein
VIIREEDDESITVGIIDPEAMFQVVNKPEMQALADEVKVRFERVMSAIKDS